MTATQIEVPWNAVGKLEARAKSKLGLSKRNKVIVVLEKYSNFLQNNGYLDTDWRSEPPYAIDEFLRRSPFILNI